MMRQRILSIFLAATLNLCGFTPAQARTSTARTDGPQTTEGPDGMTTQGLAPMALGFILTLGGLAISRVVEIRASSHLEALQQTNHAEIGIIVIAFVEKLKRYFIRMGITLWREARPKTPKVAGVPLSFEDNFPNSKRPFIIQWLKTWLNNNTLQTPLPVSISIDAAPHPTNHRTAHWIRLRWVERDGAWFDLWVPEGQLNAAESSPHDVISEIVTHRLIHHFSDWTLTQWLMQFETLLQGESKENKNSPNHMKTPLLGTPAIIPKDWNRLQRQRMAARAIFMRTNEHDELDMETANRLRNLISKTGDIYVSLLANASRNDPWLFVDEIRLLISLYEGQNDDRRIVTDVLTRLQGKMATAAGLRPLMSLDSAIQTAAASDYSPRNDQSTEHFSAQAKEIRKHLGYSEHDKKTDVDLMHFRYPLLVHINRVMSGGGAHASLNMKARLEAITNAINTPTFSKRPLPSSFQHALENGLNNWIRKILDLQPLSKDCDEQISALTRILSSLSDLTPSTRQHVIAIWEPFLDNFDKGTPTLAEIQRTIEQANKAAADAWRLDDNAPKGPETKVMGIAA